MALHWLVAAAIVTNVALAWLWPSMLPDDAVRPAIDTHKSIGVTVLGLAVLRLLWRYANPPPPFPQGYAKWETMAAHAAHTGLYVILFTMPLTGWIMDSAWKKAAENPMHYFGTFEFPRIAWIMNLGPETREKIHDWFGAAHGWLAYLLYALFLAHVGGALKHQILDREPELQRMLPGKD
jgi:cytochrome b561